MANRIAESVRIYRKFEHFLQTLCPEKKLLIRIQEILNKFIVFKYHLLGLPDCALEKLLIKYMYPSVGSELAYPFMVLRYTKKCFSKILTDSYLASQGDH